MCKTDSPRGAATGSKALCGCLIVASLAACASAQHSQSAESNPVAQPPVQHIAVLELTSKVDDADAKVIPADYFSDAIRGEINDQAPSLSVVTKENILAMLPPQSGDLADCEADCEVETGRKLGADFIVTGELRRMDDQFALVVRIHDTKTASLLKRAEARGKGQTELRRSLPIIVGQLLTSAGISTTREQQREPSIALQRPTAHPVPDSAVPVPGAASVTVQASAGCQPKASVHEVAGWTALIASLAGAAAMGAAWGEKKNIDSLSPGDSGVSSGTSTGQTFNALGIVGLGLGAAGLGTFLLSFPSPACSGSLQ